MDAVLSRHPTEAIILNTSVGFEEKNGQVCLQNQVEEIPHDSAFNDFAWSGAAGVCRTDDGSSSFTRGLAPLPASKSKSLFQNADELGRAGFGVPPSGGLGVRPPEGGTPNRSFQTGSNVSSADGRFSG